MKISLFVVVYVAILLTGLSRAQEFSDQPTEATNALPPGPLIISTMPKFSQWSVDITYTDRPKSGETSATLLAYQKAAQTDPVLAKAMANPQFLLALQNYRPVHILVTKTGTVRHDEQTMEGGGTGEMWWAGDDAVERKPNTSALSARNMEGLSATDFPELDWVSKEHFIGIQTNNDHKCLAFKMDMYSVDDHVLQGTRLAFVDFKTRYPVSYQFQAETRQYTVLPPPTAPLTMPDDFALAAKTMETRLQRATPHLSPP